VYAKTHPRNDLDLNSPLGEASDLVVLHSNVDGDDSKRSTLSRVNGGSDSRNSHGSVEDGLLDRDLGDEVSEVGIREGNELVGIPPVLSSSGRRGRRRVGGSSSSWSEREDSVGKGEKS